MPGLKVRCLGWSNTEQDAQHLSIADPLSQRRIEAGATLLNKPKMEACRVGNRLDVIVWGQVVIISGNRWKLSFQQAWDGGRERVTELWVLGAAAVPRPITGVYGEFHEVGESSDVLSTCRFTALQRAKLLQVDGISAFWNQVRVNEGEVAHLILGIVVDILRHVPIQHGKGLDVGGASTSSRHFAVLDSSQFIVLLPEIGFKDFGGG